MAKKKSYEENPSRETNTVLGGGLGALLGGVLLGLPGAIVGGGVGALVGASRDPSRMLENQRCPRGTQVQTLIFRRGRNPREKFSREEAIAWALRNGYRADKVDTKQSSYRIRQKAPGRFEPGSLRTINFSDQVKAVIGCPKAR